MVVCVYEGDYKIVRRSGVGIAIRHQRKALERAGVTLSSKIRDADIIHINTVFPLSVASAIFARMKGKKVVYYGHSTKEDFKNSFFLSNAIAPLFKCWIKFCYNLGNIIITPSEYAKDLLTGYGMRKPLYTLSNGVDTEFFKKSRDGALRFRRRYGITEKDKVVISAGHMIERKGILDFIRIARKFQSVTFIWFGHTPDGMITKKVRSALKDIPENLILAGFVSQEELRDAYSGADVFLFLSREETEGIVILEALSTSCLVIVNDIPVYRGWLTDGKNVLKCNPSNADDVLSAALSSENDLIVSNGRKTAEERDLKMIGKKLSEMYEELLPV